ncbi:MAG TPA: efflux RND transporter periplasmic adaptor subunit [Phycisphaerae bacterium]|nr:efflux RND transporter periplasmic adaptor subunit [Phycisphaerae bacterium]HPU25351.1 efflux RND transporter periplasmic adaptor subunit [Phycisphaerae bacterium]HPZ96620.1 efflux RND transporter periplasmic adaptor subunit [Phycisphaerae bacterium]HQE28757.1 efflux RND transporter periplasmic adaptor subunit [Phycisphaerae bacterium]
MRSAMDARPPGGGRLGKIVGAAMVTVGVLIVVAIARMPAPVASVPPVEPVRVNVTTQTVEPLPQLPDTFTLTGVVEPRVVVQVSAEVAGRIEAYGTRVKEVRRPSGVLPVGSPITEGQPVTAGDPLVLLNRDLLAARHDRAAAQYAHDAHEYERVADLHRRGTASSNELRIAQRSRDVSKAELDEAARSLERATITAPISGILNEWRMELGEYASPGSPVAEIVDIDQVKVLVDVPEREVGYLRVGQAAEIIPLANDGSPVEGTITFINALADQATRTTRIEVTVDNVVPEDRRSENVAPGLHQHLLRSGQIVKVRLTRRVFNEVIMIPLASVIPLEKGKEVYVVKDGRAERRPVELGFIRGRDVQILSGLQPGDQLIVSGHRLVSPGQPVNVVPAPAAESLP